MRMFREFPGNSKSPENIIFCSHQIEQIERMLTKLICKLDESFDNPELLKQQKNFVYDAGDKVIERDDNESGDTSNVLGEGKSISQFKFFLNDTHFHLDQLYKKLEGIVGSITNDDLGEMLQNGTLAADDNRVRVFVLSLSSFNQEFSKLLNQQAKHELRQHKPSNDSDCFIDLAIDPLEPLKQLHQALYDYLQGEDAKYLESLVSASLANKGSSTDSPTLSPSTSNDSFPSGRNTPSSPVLPIFRVNKSSSIDSLGGDCSDNYVDNLTDNEVDNEVDNEGDNRYYENEPFPMDDLEEINITTLKKS